jgi:putative ABC transport system permease protein
MNSVDVISMGLRNMWRRKTRTILTVLGVIIGTSSIVIMLSLGIAMNENFRREIERMGSLNIININTHYIPPEAQGGGPTKEVKLDDKALAQINAIEGVEAVTPVMYTYWKFGAGKLVGHVSVIGIDTKVMEKFDFEVEEGRLLNESDTNALVFGAYIPHMFYNPKSNYYYGGSQDNVNLMSEKLIMTMNMEYGERRRRGQTGTNTEPLPEYKVKGVGILKQSDGESDYNAYMNINHLKKLQEESERARSRSSRGWNPYQDTSRDSYQNAMVKVKDINDVQKVQEKIMEMGFGAFSLTDILESMQKTAAGIQAILGGIGAVSLLVAALGITIASTMTADRFVRLDTLMIIGLGLVAFVFDTFGGVMFAKLINVFLPKGKKINPMIGACGISAFPMSARVIHSMGLKEDKSNFLLMHAVSTNVGGQIGSVVAGGLILSLVPLFI